MKSKAAGCGSISTVISSIVLLCVSSIIIIIIIIIIISLGSILKALELRSKLNLLGTARIIRKVLTC